ncbi:helix-turn-helix transcriptional regulator [Stieleria sp. JC731]|uniref:helix-turn-helix transcriptional regulator n=1 Tax=Pirellulaceae TaxID=2691357 RepID=UPI0039656021
MDSLTVGRDLSDGNGQSLLSIEDVAAELKCSPRHVQRLAESQRMPAPLKLGTLVRWSRSSIQSWIANGCPEVTNLAGEVTQ